MKRLGILIAALSMVKLTIHLIANGNFGFHRDELLHLSASEHLAWGYYEFPPMIAFIGKLSYVLFDYSLVGMRLFSSLAGVAILILCCLITKELGGKFKAVLLAGICVLAFIPFYRNHTLFQPVAFDQLFWVLSFYALVHFVNTNKTKYLIFLGLAFGLGFLTKYTILVCALGVFLGLWFYKNGTLFKDKRLYLAIAIGLLLALPNIIWQISNDIPLLKHIASLSSKQLDGINPWDYLLDQIEMVPMFVMFLAGIVGFLFSKSLRPYRFFGVVALVIFFTMWLMKAKSYYVFALYLLLFAGGAVFIEHLLRKRPNWIYPIAGSIMLTMAFFIPEGAPLLPLKSYIAYMGHKEHNGRVELTGDFADMFGWEEQVSIVDSIYRTLPERHKDAVMLWAENYGEAGALKILGKRYGLPNPMSRHGSFWSWGPGNMDAEVWISIGNETESVNSVFDEVQLVKRLRHPYAIEEEQNIPVFICRKPKVDITAWWQSYEEHIFD